MNCLSYLYFLEHSFYWYSVLFLRCTIGIPYYSYGVLFVFHKDVLLVFHTYRTSVLFFYSYYELFVVHKVLIGNCLGYVGFLLVTVGYIKYTQSVLYICLFCIYNYLSTDKSADNHNDNITIQRIEDEHRQLGDELADIRTELQYGQKAVTRAEERVEDLQESNAVSAEKLRESRELIKRSRDIFKDVDRANGLPEAQTGSEGTTK